MGAINAITDIWHITEEGRQMKKLAKFLCVLGNLTKRLNECAIKSNPLLDVLIQSSPNRWHGPHRTTSEMGQCEVSVRSVRVAEPRGTHGRTVPTAKRNLKTDKYLYNLL
jgi:hypothetical protein